jgi:hypothetical protein
MNTPNGVSLGVCGAHAPTLNIADDDDRTSPSARAATGRRTPPVTATTVLVAADHDAANHAESIDVSCTTLTSALITNCVLAIRLRFT